jgi:hypothetical protein
MNDDVMKPPQVYAAIAAVMAKLAKVGISKDRTAQTGGSGSYKFRGIDDVYNTLAPYLSECQLLILPRVLSREVTERLSNNNKALFYVVLDVEFDFVSAADGSKHTVRVCGEAMDSGDKATNKAMSAAYKYAAFMTFAIPTEGDNDADNATHEVEGYVSEQQLAELQNKANAVGADLARFCKYFGIASLKHVPASKFDAAMSALAAKERQKEPA